MFTTPRAAALLLAAVLCHAPAWAASGMRPYQDEAEFNAALDRWRSAARQQVARRARMHGEVQSIVGPAPAMSMSAAPAAAPAKAADSAGGASESITNVQTAGVDEGGIVKRAGDHLIILRRGRLFTVRVGGGALEPSAQVDAYAPGTDPRGAWYDELLVSGQTVVVVGYSYARGGTEIGLFDLGRDGSLAWRATHHLRSFDYYSARNYASRLIGQQLVFYSPTVLQPWATAPIEQMLPAQRRWGSPALPGAFERILPPTRVYRTDDDFDPGQPLALHTVTRCDLGSAPMRCESGAVLGPAGRVFYVSANAVYVWTQPLGSGAAADQSAVFRLPLDGATPSALKASGAPADALSFLEDEQGMLNVLLREHGAGEGMSNARRGGGRMALLRVPLSAFGDGRGAAAREHYRLLPGAPAGGLQNRFVGDWLLWGAGTEAWATRFAASSGAETLSPGHQVERIESLGGHAVLVGNQGSELHFSAVQLGRSGANLRGRYTQAGARQAESRTHGFFYRGTGAEEGLLGLPVLRGGAAAAVVVLRHSSLSFSGLGELASRSGTRQDDGCKASCVDWYGNARPIFLGDRVLALMGYELVEGRVRGGGVWERISEVARVDFSPPRRTPTRPTPFE
jgi:hypothetical protein